MATRRRALRGAKRKSARLEVANLSKEMPDRELP
jgi:hypothetical protein